MGHFREDCRLCHSRNMETFLDFGMHPHSDGFVRKDQLEQPEPVFPLAADLCTECGQVQINYVVKPEYLYGEDYLYDGAITATGRTHFLGLAKEIVERYGIAADSLAVDIGSNVGLLLSGFREQGLRVQGVDPTPKMTAIAIANGIDTITECFSKEVATRIVEEKGQASVVTGTNVIAHIDDLDDLMEGMDILLREDGIFVIEAPYLSNLIEKLEYDTIYHQHLSYFSVHPIAQFAKRFGMELFDVKQTDIHGGSICMFIGRKDVYDVRPVVGELMAAEKSANLHSPARMQQFAQDVLAHRNALTKMLYTLKDQGNRLAGIGAPAKGSTLLNFCGINKSILDFVTEKNTLKVGRFTPGHHIPILPDAALVERAPDYALILPWNFAPEIMKNLEAYRKQGGKFILPIPTPQIL
ncbi:methyltransferase [Candidatus Peregrinibacteria bacterium CG10_big_fil_rev_8_21_14_0_10_49_10]|nr:MAG: methyltransferase [Candidatus Peregrinibacteria bacterium CG10_big_fil_rev_8_21_14_0_10_49_10]